MQNIDTLREEIDRIDERLIKLLSRRRQISQDIGGLKNDSGKPVYDRKREKNMLDSLFRTGSSLKVPKKLIQTLYRAIIEDSRNLQPPPPGFDKNAEN